MWLSSPSHFFIVKGDYPENSLAVFCLHWFRLWVFVEVLAVLDLAYDCMSISFTFAVGSVIMGYLCLWQWCADGRARSLVNSSLSCCCGMICCVVADSGTRRVSFHCCVTSTETARTVRDGDPRMSTSSFAQLMSSDIGSFFFSFPRGALRPHKTWGVFAVVLI